MEIEWKKIPVENSILQEMEIYGNGKRCSLSLSTKNPDRDLFIPMSNPSIEVIINGKISTSSFSNGDNDLGIKYIPREKLKIIALEIIFPGEDEEWTECLKNFNEEKSDFIHWTIYDAKISIDRF